MKQPSKKPNKPWADRKKRQILEGKRTDAEIETDNEKEIARWERKKEEIKMTTTTAEKQTCTYELVGGYAYTECGQKNWEHTTADLTTCQNCGKKIKRVERNDG